MPGTLTVQSMLTRSLTLAEEKGQSGSWNWDLETNKVDWSSGLLQIFQIDPRAVTPDFRIMEDAMHPEDGKSFPTLVRNIATGLVADFTIRIIRKDGELRRIRSYVNLLRAQNGTPCHVTGVTFDITDAWQLRETGLQQDRLFAAMQHVFDLAVWRTGPSGPNVQTPGLWRTSMQDRQTSWLAREIAVHPDDLAELGHLWGTAVRSGETLEAHYRVEDGAGGYLSIMSRGEAVRDAGGKIQNWSGFSTRTSVPVHTTLPFSPPEEVKLTPGHLRAARGYLDWTVNDLASKAGVSFSTVRRLEAGADTNVRDRNVRAIVGALQAAGIRFHAAGAGAAIILPA